MVTVDPPPSRDEPDPNEPPTPRPMTHFPRRFQGRMAGPRSGSGIRARHQREVEGEEAAHPGPLWPVEHRLQRGDFDLAESDQDQRHGEQSGNPSPPPLLPGRGQGLAVRPHRHREDGQ